MSKIDRQIRHTFMSAWIIAHSKGLELPNGRHAVKDGVFHASKGRLHREGGHPAVEWEDGHKEWWINGKFVSATRKHRLERNDLENVVLPLSPREKEFKEWLSIGDRRLMSTKEIADAYCVSYTRANRLILQLEGKNHVKRGIHIFQDPHPVEE